MKGIQKVLLKAISAVMTVSLMSGGIFSVTAYAAAPVITVKTGQESAQAANTAGSVS